MQQNNSRESFTGDKNDVSLDPVRFQLRLTIDLFIHNSNID